MGTIGGTGASMALEDPQPLVTRLLEAAACPPGKPLTGTAEVAWQLCELMLSIITMRDEVLQRAQLERAMHAMVPLVGENKVVNDYLQCGLLPSDQAMDQARALRMVLAAYTLMCDSQFVEYRQNELMAWWVEWGGVPDDYAREYTSFARLQQESRHFENPGTSIRDRAAIANFFLNVTHQSLNSQEIEASCKLEVLRNILESGILQVMGAAMLTALPTSCSAEQDPWMQFGSCANALISVVTAGMGICNNEAVPELYNELCHHCIDNGWCTAMCRYIEMFERSDPAEDRRVEPWFGLIVNGVQLLASGKGTARRILADCCSSPKALHSALVACRARGSNCPIGIKAFDVELKAGMCLAVLFGREEHEEGANTVPAGITAEIVQSMKAVIDGESFSSLANLADVMKYLSVSDANTAAMVYPSNGGTGVLDVFTTILQQDVKIVEARSPAYRYNVAVGREKCCAVLLDLALSDQTAKAVASHIQLLSAAEHALADTDNLTETAKKLLKDILFQVKLVTTGPDKLAAAAAATNNEALGAGSAEQERKHVMMS